MMKRVIVAAVMMGAMLLGLAPMAVAAQAAPIHHPIASSCLGSWEYINSDTRNFTSGEVTFQEHTELDGIFSPGAFCYRLRAKDEVTYVSCSGSNCSIAGNLKATLTYETLSGTITSTTATQSIGLSPSQPSYTVTTATAVAQAGSAGGDFTVGGTDYHVGAAWW